MKVIPPWSKEPTLVFAISWSSALPPAVHCRETTLDILDGNVLVSEHAGDCEIVDDLITNFVILPLHVFAPDTVLMWKPLADAGIWDELRDHSSDAISKFSELRATELLQSEQARG